VTDLPTHLHRPDTSSVTACFADSTTPDNYTGHGAGGRASFQISM
jgi:hypothetical protein